MNKWTAIIAIAAAAAGFGAGTIVTGDFHMHPWAQFLPGAEVTFEQTATYRDQSVTATYTHRYIGEETLRVGGAPVRCIVIETTSESNGQRATSRVWQSADVPGFIVRSEASSPEGTQTLSATSFRAER